METGTENTFNLTPQQKANLNEWKTILTTEQAKQWAVEEKEAIDAMHVILKKAGFEEGNDLTPEQLDWLFHHIRQLIWNRSLARNLYEDNGLANFNSRLRRLLFSSEPVVERIDQFLQLRRVGILTVSQFLCALNRTEYPEISGQTLSVLDLDSTQIDTAYRQAMRENGISSPENYRSDTLEYLADAIIFRVIKNFLGIELYTSVNDLLWLAFVHEEKGETLVSITSVSLEKDLQEYLAMNPGLVEKGLKLVEEGKNYNIKGAGTIDLLCRDKAGKYVIVETKKGRGSDEVVGQVLRYIGGLKTEGKRARGIIIVNEPDDKLDFAIEAVKDLIKLRYYKVKFEIADSYES